MGNSQQEATTTDKAANDDIDSNTGNKNKSSEEEFADKDKLKWKMDASGGGCSGMFWRTAPSMHATSSATDWPKNGTIFYGWKSKQNPGWIKVDHPNGYWMPIQQYGKTVAHQQ